MSALPQSGVKLPQQGARSLAVPVLGLETLALLSSVAFALLYNLPFWHAVMALHPSPRLLAALLLVIVALHGFLLGLVLERRTARGLLAVLFCVSAIAAYYTASYGIYLDADMLRNVLHTDMREASELLVPGLLPYMVLLGVVPVILLWNAQLKARGWRRAAWQRIAFLVGMLAMGAAGIGLDFQGMSSLVRNQREVRYLVTPANYIVSLASVLTADPPGQQRTQEPIGLDARQQPRAAGSHPRLIVLMVGETARAANWGLNGYARQTTPQLAALPEVINFRDVESCGTDTEVSVPCMFSPWGRHDYNESTIRGHQSLLHVLDHAGIATLWRDNQTGCKGVCTGLPFTSTRAETDPALCPDKTCLDEILLRGIDQQLVHDGRDQVIVLHPLGNHGPAYYQRYPARFRRYLPTCDTGELGRCSREQIVNSYDNGLLYADDMIARTIGFLRAQSAQYDTALIYVSDHGESLGENGIYLHGLPRAIAPAEQLHVPMVMWFSPSFARNEQLDLHCLRREAQAPATHDNIFPSMLGLLQVRTALYEPARDLFQRCRVSHT